MDDYSEEEEVSMMELDNPQPHRRIFIVDILGNRVTTTVTSTSYVVKNWIYSTWHFYRYYRNRLVVGLGVQWYPDYGPGSNNPAATLQLCVGRRCLIFQLIHADSVPNVLRLFLSDPNTTFVGIRNNRDEDKLWNSEHVLDVQTPLDIGRFVASELGRGDLLQASMETLAREVLGWEGLRKDQVIGRSAWDAYELSYDQVRYASVDACVSFEIGKKLRAWELSSQ